MKNRLFVDDAIDFQDETELLLSERLEQTINNLDDVIWLWDMAGKTIVFSKKWHEITGYTNNKSPLSLEVLSSVIHSDDLTEVSNYFIKAESSDFVSFRTEFRVRDKYNNYKWMSCNGASDSKGTAPKIISGILRDISYQKSLEKKLKYANDYDAVTGLASYKHIEDRLNSIAKQEKENAHSYAVFTIDLDGFRTIRDTYGVTVGNQLLKLTGERINKCIGKNDLVSRIDGDQFIVLLSDINGENNARVIAVNILNIIEAPFFTMGYELYASASIGIVLLPVGCENTNEVIANGNSALCAAKASGKNQYQFFREKLNAKRINSYAIEAELRHSIRNDELQIYYQPIVKGITGKVAGVEALLRWNNPSRGILLPDDFIPIAEKTGLIIPIGNYVLYNVCAQVNSWHKKGYSNLFAAVNISIIQLLQKDFIDTVKKTLELTGVDPNYIEMEITESVFVESMKKATNVLYELKDLGIRIALDDFGTAYSSLNYLKSLPIDKIKIDKSFTGDISKSPKNEAIISAMITLSNKMHIEIVAEGVETVDQLNYLLEQGCELIQGYLFSKPLPLEEINEVIEKSKIDITIGNNYYQI